VRDIHRNENEVIKMLIQLVLRTNLF